MHSSSIFFMFFIAFRCWFHSCFTFGYLTTLGAIWSIIICKSVRTAAILTLENSIPSSPPATQARPQGSHGIVMWVVEFKSESSKNVYCYLSGDTWAAEGTQDHQILICKSVRTAAILTLENSIPSSPPATQARPQGSHGIVMWVVEFKSENSKECIVICLGIISKAKELWKRP